MMHISPADAAALRAFRLQVKERLYRFNFVSRVELSPLHYWVETLRCIPHVDGMHGTRCCDACRALLRCMSRAPSAFILFGPVFTISSCVANTNLQEVLAQLEKQERLEKLEETFQNVREDYARLIAKVRWQ